MASGDVVPATTGGQLVTLFCMMVGVTFMTIPITIVGNRFAQVWEERRTATVVLAIQKGMIEMGMRPTDLVVKFVEECPSSDDSMNFEEFVSVLATLKLRLPLAEVCPVT